MNISPAEIEAIAHQVAEELKKDAVREVQTTTQAANYLGVSKQRLEIWRHQGKGPRFIKLARMVRYRKSDIDEFLEQHKCSSTFHGGSSNA